MKVAIVSELYAPSVGGQEIRYTEMAEYLAAAGHDVDVYCIAHRRTLAANEVRNGVRIHRYPVAPRYTVPWLKMTRRQILPLLRFAAWARSGVRHDDVDLVIYNQWPLVHVIVASASTRRKAVLDWCEVRNATPYALAQRFLPRLTKQNMAVSPSVQTHISKVSGRPVAYLPSGIHCDRYRFRPHRERASLLYLGRITEHKNLGFLIATFEALRRRGYDRGLLIAGTGPSIDATRRRAAESPCRDSIMVLGKVAERDKIQLLASSELLVITSRREGFPRVVAEAMASGLPVVTPCFPENGTADVVRHYHCGEVAPPLAEAMAETILSVLANWDAYSQRALARAGELDWSKLIPVLEDAAKSLGRSSK